MDEAFTRIHFAKVRLNKEEGRYELIDNFNKVSFTATISEDDRNHLKLQDMEDTTLFSIVKNTEDTWGIKSVRGEDIGFVTVQGSSVTSAQILGSERQLLFQATRIPLIQKTNEFQVTTSEGDVCGRINSVRSKAVLSMQPELKSIHRIKIVATAIVLLGIYNQCW